MTYRQLRDLEAVCRWVAEHADGIAEESMKKIKIMDMVASGSVNEQALIVALWGKRITFMNCLAFLCPISEKPEIERVYRAAHDIVGLLDKGLIQMETGRMMSLTSNGNEAAMLLLDLVDRKEIQ